MTATQPNPIVAAREAAVRAFNEATGYALDPAGFYPESTVEDMQFVALMRGRVDLVKQIKAAFTH